MKIEHVYVVTFGDIGSFKRELANDSAYLDVRDAVSAANVRRRILYEPMHRWEEVTEGLPAHIERRFDNLYARKTVWVEKLFVEGNQEMRHRNSRGVLTDSTLTASCTTCGPRVTRGCPGMRSRSALATMRRWMRSERCG